MRQAGIAGAGALGLQPIAVASRAHEKSRPGNSGQPVRPHDGDAEHRGIGVNGVPVEPRLALGEGAMADEGKVQPAAVVEIVGHGIVSLKSICC